MRQRTSALAKAILVPTFAAGGILTMGAAAGWLLFSRTRVPHAAQLLPALDGERRAMITSAGEALSYYVDWHNPGRPLVVLHGIHAAASAYDVKPIYDHFVRTRPVYAPDLPGFGFSERTDREYTPQLYASAIIDVLSRARDQWGPADVVALSVTCEFAAMAAVTRRDLVHSLTMISPTGLSVPRRRTQREARARDRSDRRFPRLAGHFWAQPLYDLLVSRPMIRKFLGKHFVGAPDAGLAEYAYATSHRPGARFAPLHFLAGKLFTRDIRHTAYEALQVPTLILFDEDPYVSFEGLPELVGKNRYVQAVRIRPSHGMPHFEWPDMTFRALEGFLDEARDVQPSP